MKTRSSRSISSHRPWRRASREVTSAISAPPRLPRSGSWCQAAPAPPARAPDPAGSACPRPSPSRGRRAPGDRWRSRGCRTPPARAYRRRTRATPPRGCLAGSHCRAPRGAAAIAAPAAGSRRSAERPRRGRRDRKWRPRRATGPRGPAYRPRRRPSDRPRRAPPPARSEPAEPQLLRGGGLDQHARPRRLGRGERLVFARLRRLIDLLAHVVVDVLQVLLFGPVVADELLHVAIDGVVLLRPALDLVLRLIRLVVVLGVALAAVGLHLDEVRSEEHTSELQSPTKL